MCIHVDNNEDDHCNTRHQEEDNIRIDPKTVDNMCYDPGTTNFHLDMEPLRSPKDVCEEESREAVR